MVKITLCNKPVLTLVPHNDCKLLCTMLDTLHACKIEAETELYSQPAVITCAIINMVNEIRTLTKLDERAFDKIRTTLQKSTPTLTDS